MIKYLAVLLVLAGCGNKENLYKKKDCIRVYSSSIVSDYVVVDTFKDKYVLCFAFKRDGEAVYAPKHRYLFTADELIDNSKKINCEDVE